MKRFIDIYIDIMYTYTKSNYLSVISKTLLERKSPSNFFKRFGISLLWMVRDVVNPIRAFIIKLKKKEISPAGKIWIFTSSKNQFDSFGFLRNRIPNSIIVAPDLRNLVLTDFIIPYYFKIFYYIKLPILWFGFLTKNSSISLRYFNFLFEVIGLYEISEMILKKYKPRAIVFANDHLFKHRALLLAAKSQNIQTCYIQHASVSNLFPPLSFDLSMLEGLDSLKKYEECGESDSIIKLVGMPKFDDYINYKRKPEKDIKTIGIAINPSDDHNEVFMLIEELNKNLSSHKILLRPHPKDFRLLRSSKIRFEYSDSKSETAFDFLTGIDLLISGGSSIHLEAALLHIPCIMYGFNHEKEITDSYGYLRNGLVQKAENPETVIQLIKENNIKIDIDKLRYYNAVLDTKWEGKSKDLITNILIDFLN